MSAGYSQTARADTKYMTYNESKQMELTLNEKIAAVKQDTEVLKTRLNMVIGILTAVGVAILSVAVKMLFGV